VKWIKKGLIFDPKNNQTSWIRNYASVPVCDLISDELLRIYFSTRDEQGRSILTYLETSPANPNNIITIMKSPILQLGEMGTFDDNGIMPSCVVDNNGLKYLYYIGWNPQKTVSYRLSIGLAISKDGGLTFKKYSTGPILDRDIDEPYFNTAPFVLKEGGLWKMWYVSCTKWEIINDWPEPFYHIKYAESQDGINWFRKNIVCLDYDDFSDGFAKPFVFKEKDIYKMFYSFRSAKSYRTDLKKSYRLGYAESQDGINWIRKDNKLNLGISQKGWDSNMIEYPSSYVVNNKRYLVYNGNKFGESGIGYAVLKDEKE
jgi:hypothetical protein